MPDPQPAIVPAAAPVEVAKPAVAAEVVAPAKPADAASAKPAVEVAKPAEMAKPAEPVKPAEQTPEQKAAADKEAKERDDRGRFVPAELKVPEGAKVDPGALETFKGVAKEIGISTKQAQALLEMQLKSNAAQEQALTEAMQRQRVADLESLKGDREFGGAFFDQTRAASRSILAQTKYGPAVSKKLEQYGLDCDPDFTRLFAEFRSLVAEDTTSSRVKNAAPSGESSARSQTDRMAETYKQHVVK